MNQLRLQEEQLLAPLKREYIISEEIKLEMVLPGSLQMESSGSDEDKVNLHFQKCSVTRVARFID